MNDNNYEIDSNKLSPSLKIYFTNNMEKNKINMENKIDEQNTYNWNPPKEHGLNNSTRIIPKTIFNSYNNIFDIDYYDMIIHDIRNLKTLNEYQLKFIKSLDNDMKQKLFEEFNNMIMLINQIF
jgi:hypothetical protein